MRGLSTFQKKAKNTIKIKYSLVFLACLLVLLTGWANFCYKVLLTGWPCFCFKAVNLIIGLMVGLAIDCAVSMALKIAIGLLK